MAVSNIVQQIVLLRYGGRKIIGLLYIATLGYMDEIIRHEKQKWWQLVGSSLQGPKLAIHVIQGKKYSY